MLEQTRLNNKTYHEIFQKALATIPTLSDEWTDYNYSDPGVTVLQVLSLIKLFQQSYVDKINNNIKHKLIKLMGYDIEDVKPSLAHIKIDSNFNFKIYPGAKMTAGNVIFENIYSQDITCSKLSKVVFYDNFNKKYTEDNLNLNQSETVRYVFGKTPVEGAAVYLVFDQPLEINKSYNIYLEINKKINQIREDIELELSKIKWEILTQNGWEKLYIKDTTKGFIQSGIVTIKVKNKMIKNILCNIGEGYIIRAVLEKNNYNIAPQIKNIDINILDIRQSETLAKSYLFDGNGEDEQEFVIENYITVYDNIMVLLKDKDGSYIRHKISRKNFCGICEIHNDFNGKLLVKFDKNKFGVVPLKEKEAVKIICYAKEFQEQNIKTKIYGFENQVIKISNQDQVIASEFDFMIKIIDHENKERFLNLNNLNSEIKEPLVRYNLDSVTNQIKISSVNIAGDIDLVITDLVRSKGKNGNVRENEINSFEKHLLDKIKKSSKLDEINKNFIMSVANIRNLDDSTGGKNVESIDEAVFKIINDISATHSLVTKKDFENKIFDLPGVSIHKAKAISNNENNSVYIIIKPNSDERLPVLTDVYKDLIIKYLDRYRLITTEINILSPIYVPIDVSGSIYVKPNYKDAGNIIRDLISRELDGVTTDRDFGTEIIYGNLYSKIENLDCVDMISSLFLESNSSFAFKNINSNIVLDKSALSYLGNYNIEINNNIMMVV